MDHALRPSASSCDEPSSGSQPPTASRDPTRRGPGTQPHRRQAGHEAWRVVARHNRLLVRRTTAGCRARVLAVALFVLVVESVAASLDVAAALVWDDLRRQLGFGNLSFETGTWWCVPHAAVRLADGRLFSSKNAGDGRRVVLATAFGPNATLFARSASIGTTYEHPAHVHPGGSARCRIAVRGWINFRLPVNVSTDVLDEEHFSCEEPADSTLWETMAAAVAP